MSTPTQNIVNAVTQVVTGIHTNPESAYAVFRASSVLNEGLLANIKIRDFNLISDEPLSLGGTDKGPNPVELVLGAFASCQEIVIAAYAAVLGITVTKIHVDVKGDLDLRGFFNVSDKVRPGFTGVAFETTIHTTETDAEKLEQLRFFAQNRCPVLDILQNAVPTTGTIAFSAETLN